MRRRVVIAAAVVSVLVLAIGLFMARGSRQRAASRADHREVTTAHTAAGTSRAGVSRATRNLAGSVYLDDTLAAGATVRIIELRGSYRASRQADKRGHFDFGPVPVDEYRVIAELPRATGTAIDVDLRDRVLDADNLRLVMHACDASLHGVVRDASGGVIGRAHVLVSEQFGEGPGADAGDDGAYELCVPVGDSAVIVRADGYADAYAFVSAFGRVRRDFELVPEAVVSGRTVRASDGASVAGAQLTLQAESHTSVQQVQTLYTVSDADGQFRFRGVAAGQYSLSATADRLASAEPVHVEADIATPSEGLECRLVPAFSIAGHVVEKQSKKPAPSRVLWAIDHQGVAEAPQRATSGSDGAFVFDKLVPGEYRISGASIRADAELQVKLDKADVSGLTIEVDALASIAGRVTRAGKPVDGASLQAEPTDPGDPPRRPRAYATTDAYGRFVLRQLPAGSYRLYAESKRVGAFTRGPVVTVGEAEQKAGVDVEMNLAGSIAGTVVDQTGAPVAGAHLRFSLLQGRDFGEATTADDGTFKAAALSGGGEYMYEVRPTAHSTLKLRPADGARFTPIAVRDGDSRVTGVTIKVQFERLSIRGRVVASDGSGVPDIPVTAERKKVRGFGPTAMTDANGAFTIRDLPAGQYNVYTRSAIGSARVDGVGAGAKNVELRLPELGAIEGTLEGFATSPSVGAASTSDDMMGPLGYRATVTGKAFSIKRVPVGTYSVWASSKDGIARATTTVKGNGVVSVVLRNPGVGAIEGRVVDETTRKPVIGIRCMSSVMSRTDTSGTFRLERVAAGSAEVVCYGSDIEAHASVTVEPGKTARVELAAKKMGRPMPARSYAGLELEIQAFNVVVKKVVPGGPAARAAIKSGDIVREIEEEEVDAMQDPQWVLRMIEAGPVGTSVKLTLERDGKERTVELVLEPHP